MSKTKKKASKNFIGQHTATFYQTLLTAMPLPSKPVTKARRGFLEVVICFCLLSTPTSAIQIVLSTTSKLVRNEHSQPHTGPTIESKL